MKVIFGGEEIAIGTAEATPTISLIDFSRRETDDYGVTRVVPRGFARRMAVRLAIPTEEVDAVRSKLMAMRATPAQWIVDEECAWLNFEGFYRDFEIDIAIPPLSYCTLTVEGLAETEAPADPVGDPAADGASTLRLVAPVAVTDAMLTASNVAENDHPAWSASTTYAQGARVIKLSTHRIYESAAAGNIGHDPEAADGHWFDIGATNRWAMFDEALGSTTRRGSEIALTLAAGDVDALALFDLRAATARVQRGVYDRTLPATGGSALFLDLPLSADPITVTLAGTGLVEVGTLTLGRQMTLGQTEAAPSAGITDFSRKEVDDFGEVTLVERAWAKRMSARALIGTDAIDLVANRIAAVRARACVWVADEALDTLVIYGFARDAEIVRGERVSKLSLTVEGLSKAAPLAPPERPSINPRGPYDPDVEYEVGDVAFWRIADGGDGNSYARIGSGPTLGVSPADGAKWALFLQGGVPGTPGAPGAPGMDGEDGVDGADGKLIEFVWRRAASQPATPTGPGIPAGWSDNPEAGTLPLWMSKAKKELDGTLVLGEAWSVPVRHDGPPGPAAFTLVNQSNTVVGVDWVEKVSGGSDPNGLAHSRHAFAGGAFCSFTVPTTGAFIEAGLGTVPGAPAQYAIRIFADNTARVIEGGVQKAVISNVHAPTDLYQIAYDGRTVRYLINGQVLHTTPDRPAGQVLHFDVRMVLVGRRIENIKFGPAGSAGTDGAQGNTGPVGAAGSQGPAGPSGQTLYTWIAYANNATGTSGFTTGANTGQTYIGIANNKPTATEGTDPADYTWSLIKGTNGAPGTPGADGQPTFTWIAYSSAPNGSSDFTTGAPTPGVHTYLGLAANRATATESSNPEDYHWSLIKGADGEDGIDGAPGQDAVTVSPASYSTSVKANSGGVVDAGELPVVVTFTVKRGTTDISTLATTTYAAAVSDGTGGMGGANNRALSIGTMSADKTEATVSIFDDGNLVAQPVVTVTKARSGSAAVAAMTQSIAIPTSTAYGPVHAGPLALASGNGGRVYAYAFLSYARSAGGISNVRAKVQYRTSADGETWSTWSDMAPETESDAPSTGEELGSLSLSNDVAHVGASRFYQLRLLLRTFGVNAPDFLQGSFMIEWRP